MDPNDAAAYYNRGTSYDEKKDYDKAISDYDKVVKLNPKEENAYFRRGLVYYYNKKDYDKAIGDFTEVTCWTRTLGQPTFPGDELI